MWRFSRRSARQPAFTRPFESIIPPLSNGTEKEREATNVKRISPLTPRSSPARLRPLDSTPNPRRDRIAASLVFVGTLVVYIASPSPPMTDSRYALLLSDQIVRRGTFALDEYFPRPPGEKHATVAEIGDHIYYWFPAGGSILSAPLVALLRPFGLSVFDSQGAYDADRELRLQRIVASLLMSGLVALLFFTARLFLPLPWSVATALAAAFGTGLWSTASRCHWPETWGLALTGVVVHLLALMEVRGRRPGSILLATLLAWTYFARPTYAITIICVSAYGVWRQRSLLVPFVSAGAVWLGLFVAHSLWVYDSALPAYYAGSRLSFSIVETPVRLAGVLFSPSRGVLWTMPVLVVITFVLARRWRLLPYRGLAALALIVTATYVLMLGFWPIWWGSQHGYMCRYAAPLVPWAVLLGAMALRSLLDTPATRRVPLAACAAVVLLSVAIHARGACSAEANRWNSYPVGIDEDPWRAWSLRAPQFLGGLAGDPGPGAQSFTDRAQKLLTAGDTNGALHELDACVRLYPRSQSAWLARGVTHHLAGDHDSERRDFEAAVRMNPLMGEPHFNLALSLEEQRDDLAALQEYGRAIDVMWVCMHYHPQLPSAYRNRAVLRFKRGDIPGAIEDLDQFVLRRPLVPDGYAERGELREAHGDTAGAIADYEKALRLLPSSADVRETISRRLQGLRPR